MFKKIFTILCLIGSTLSGHAQYDQNFSLEGYISGLKDGTIIYLTLSNKEKPQRLDTISSVISKSEKFTFKGQVVNNIDFYYLQIDSAISKLPTQGLVLVNTKMMLTGDLTKWPKVELTGSKPHEEYEEILQLNKGMNAELRTKMADASTAKTAKIALFTPYIKAHSSSLLMPFLIGQLQSDLNFVELNQLYNGLSKEAKVGSFGIRLKEDLQHIEKLSAIQIGNIVPDFKMKMRDGTETSIRTLASKSEFTLIDFWASWCKPCRWEIPNLKTLYEAYGKKGFNILGISQDKKEDQWRKAISEDSTEWSQALDTNEVYKSIFDLRGIPSYMMLDRTGKIISLELFSPIKSGGPGLRGKVLHETVKKLLNL